MSRKSTRRDFLGGRSAADALVEIGRASSEASRDASDGGPWGEGYTVRVGRRAMACQFEVCLNAGQYEHATEVALRALEQVATLEEQLSFFRPESELSRLNRTAADEAVELSSELFELIELGLAIHEQTGGAFDLTATPLWETWGFAARSGRVPSESELAEALDRVGSRWIELDPRRRSVRFLKRGVRLNLGSIGKGYAVDRCAAMLLEAGIEDFLIHGGYSSVLARGSQANCPAPTTPSPTNPRAEPTTSASRPVTGGWLVGVRHPVRNDRRVGQVRLVDRAMGTSGSWFQSFRHDGKRLGHVIDPRTGRPAEGVISVTVLAPSAALADALATAFYVMGPEAAAELAAQRADLGVVVARPSRRGGGLELKLVGLPDGTWIAPDGSGVA